MLWSLKITSDLKVILLAHHPKDYLAVAYVFRQQLDKWQYCTWTPTQKWGIEYFVIYCREVEEITLRPAVHMMLCFPYERDQMGSEIKNVLKCLWNRWIRTRLRLIFHYKPDFYCHKFTHMEFFLVPSSPVLRDLHSNH